MECHHPEESNIFSKCKNTKRRWSGNKCCKMSTSCDLLLHSRNQNTLFRAWKHNTSTWGNMLFLFAQRIDAQMPQKMPIACHVWQKQCPQKYSLVLNESQMWFMLKLSNKTWYWKTKNSSKNIHVSVPCARHPHKKVHLAHTTFVGELKYSCGHKKHDKLCAPLTTFYLIFMNVQTHVMGLHSPYPWTIESMQSAIANAIPTFCISFSVPSHIFV